MQELLERIALLERKIEHLIQENQALKAENAVLRLENAALRLENGNLKERLGLNSKNSSLPPSRDIYKKKQASRARSVNNPGGQPGHEGSTRKADVATTVIECKVPEHCDCGGVIELNGKYIHQKVELPRITPEVIEYQLYKGICKKCKKKVRATLPDGVTPDLLGDKAKTVVAAFSGFYGNSKREVQQILHNIFGLKISLGLVSETERRVSGRCAEEYERIKEKIEDSACLHIDETGHRNAGKRGWAWIFSSAEDTLLKLENTRSKKVLESVLPEYDGVVVSDRYAAYKYFKDSQRQVCWAHLMRDFERFAGSANVEVSRIGMALVKFTRQMFTIWKAYKTGEVGKLELCRRIEKVQNVMWYFLRRALCLENAPQAVRVANNILNSERMMWKFLDSPGLIQPTNNLAEQQIRKYVLYRKKSLFTWSERGERYIERIFSLFLSCKLQNDNPFTKLENLVKKT